MGLRSFKDLPLPMFIKLPLFMGLGVGTVVFILSLLSPVTFVHSLYRGLIAILLVFSEALLILYLLSKHNLDSLFFGRKVSLDLSSLASLKEFAWVYKTRKEAADLSSQAEERPSLEKLLSQSTELGKDVEELTGVAKKNPEAIAKAIRVMMEES